MRHERIVAVDAQALLARALIGAARAAGVAARIASHRSRPWASATFVGEQHAVTLSAEPSSALRDWLAVLPDAELTMRGHFVASLSVDSVEDHGAVMSCALTVLTLEHA